MKNKTPQAIRPALAKGRVAIIGLTELGVGIGVDANDLETFSGAYYHLAGRPAEPTATPPVAAIVGKQPLYLERKVQHAIARAAYQQAVADGRLFVEQAVDTLKGMFGRRWSAEWMAIGFTSGSLQLPRDPVPTLTLLEAHYRTHPEHESPAVNLTQVEAAEVLAAIDTALGAMNLARDNEVSAKAERDASFTRLRMRLSALRDELGTILTLDDSRWYRFGFRRPVDGETPDLVEEVRLRLGSAGEVVVEWSQARLAVNYRVSWKLTGSTEDPTEVGLFADQMAIISGLPPGANITAIVTARNAAGESAPMEAAIVLP